MPVVPGRRLAGHRNARPRAQAVEVQSRERGEVLALWQQGER